jgi:hypothetical protein
MLKVNRRASYQSAIDWIASNDDNEWLGDEFGSPSVTLSLVADIFGRDTETATRDLKRAMRRMGIGVPVYIERRPHSKPCV